MKRKDREKRLGEVSSWRVSDSKRHTLVVVGFVVVTAVPSFGTFSWCRYYVALCYVVLRPLDGEKAGLLCGGEFAGDVTFGFTLSVEFRGIRIELATDLLGRFCK